MSVLFDQHHGVKEKKLSASSDVEKKDIDSQLQTLFDQACSAQELSMSMPVIVWPKIAMQLKGQTKRGNGGGGQIFR